MNVPADSQNSLESNTFKFNNEVGCDSFTWYVVQHVQWQARIPVCKACMAL